MWFVFKGNEYKYIIANQRLTWHEASESSRWWLWIMKIRASHYLSSHIGPAAVAIKCERTICFYLDTHWCRHAIPAKKCFARTTFPLNLSRNSWRQVYQNQSILFRRLFSWEKSNASASGLGMQKIEPNADWIHTVGKMARLLQAKKPGAIAHSNRNVRKITRLLLKDFLPWLPLSPFFPKLPRLRWNPSV